MIPMDERAFMEYRGKNGVAPMIRTSKKDLATDLVASMNCSLARETMYIYIYRKDKRERSRSLLQLRFDDRSCTSPFLIEISFLSSRFFRICL